MKNELLFGQGMGIPPSVAIYCQVPGRRLISWLNNDNNKQKSGHCCKRFLSCQLLGVPRPLPLLCSLNKLHIYASSLDFFQRPSPPLVGIIVGPTRCDATRRKINNFRNGFFNDTNYEFLIGTAAGHLSPVFCNIQHEATFFRTLLLHFEVLMK